VAKPRQSKSESPIPGDASPGSPKSQSAATAGSPKSQSAATAGSPKSQSAATAGSPNERPRRIRPLWALGALILVVILAAGAYLVVPGLLSSGNQQTVWQKISAGITDGNVPKDTALEAFAYVLKVDIPGVTVPSGVDGSDKPTSGTGVLSWVENVWDQLTPAQQAVIDKATATGPDDTVINLDATTGKYTTGGGATATRAPAGGLASGTTRAPAGGLAFGAIRLPIGAQAPAAGAPSQALVDAMTNDLAGDIVRIGNRLGIPPISFGSLLWTNVTLTLSQASGGNALFITHPEANQIHYSPCHIVAYKEAWGPESPTQNGGVSPRLHVLITHEVVHCYQNVVAGDVSTANGIPPWIGEGTAAYLAADDTKTVEDSLPSDWKDGWFGSPETPLTNRNYDAIGYYSMLAHQGRDLWGTMAAAWKAMFTNPQHSDAFIAFLNGDALDVRGSLASSLLREPTWGADWQTYGFGIPNDAKVFAHPVDAIPDPGTQGSLQSRANTVLSVNSAQGELVAVVTNGLASLHDANGQVVDDFQQETFCVSGDCTCPDGTLLAGKKLGDHQISMPFTLAINSPEGGADWAVISIKLDDACGKKQTPPPSLNPQPAAPCANGACGQTNGDPHLQTINLHRYDFQAAGEFTLLRSPDGTLEIQGRQEPYKPSSGGFQINGLTANISTNTAIAALVNGHKVGVYVVGGALQVHVDGAVTSVTSAVGLGNGASIAPYPKGYEIDFPDGTKLWTLSVGEWGINALVKPSADLKKSGVGLLGPVIPGGLGVPNLPDGTRLPAAANRHDRWTVLYGQFADAWRVTDSTSLFDYDPGKSTATYTIKGFPAETADVTYLDLTPDQRSAGQSACASITDPVLNEDCVFDVAASGDAGFASSYEANLVLSESGIAAPTPAPASPAAPTPGASLAGNAFAVMPVTDLGGYVVSPDSKLYASVGTGDNQYAIVEIDPTTGKVVTQVTEPVKTDLHFAAGSLWAPGLDPQHPCTVTRLDAASLAVQATINVPCDFFGKATVASDGDALWYQDVSKYDLGTDKGATIVRIDPSTNQPSSTSVALPFLGGYLKDSYGALFYYDTGSKGLYRLVTGQTALESLGTWKPFMVLGGTGAWLSSQDGKSAQHIGAGGNPDATIQIDGTVVAGNDTAAFVQVEAADGSTQLWSFPIDGSNPTQLATAPTVGNGGLSYFGDPQATVGPHGLVKLWLVRGDSGQTLYEQWVPMS
jgi:hypothetical protein